MRSVFETIAKNGQFDPVVAENWYDYTPADIIDLVSFFLALFSFSFCFLFRDFIIIYFNVGWRTGNT